MSVGRINNNLKFFPIFSLSKRFNHKHEPCVPKSDSSLKTVYGQTECQTAIIFGGTGDIGIAIARQLLCEKVVKVGLVDTDICKGKELVTTLNCSFGKDKAVFAKADVTDNVAVRDALEMLIKDFKKPTDILVNALGFWDENCFEKEICVNLTGIIFVNNVAKNFVRKTGGTVINIVGSSGLEVYTPSPVLSATYAGVTAYSRAMGHQRNFAHTGLRVVTLCTGITDTNFVKHTSTKTCCKEMAKDLEIHLKEACWQKPDAVGKAVIQLVRYAATGTVWVVEGSRLFSVKIPSWQKKAVLESQFI